MLQMILSLAAVVAMILGLAWMTRRVQNLRGTQSGELRVRATIAVGLKESVVIVEAAGQQFLIGVAPGQVSILKAMGPCSPSSPHAVERNSGGACPANESRISAMKLPQSRLRESFAYQLKQLLRR